MSAIGRDDGRAFLFNIYIKPQNDVIRESLIANIMKFKGWNFTARTPIAEIENKLKEISESLIQFSKQDQLVVCDYLMSKIKKKKIKTV